MPSIVLKSGDEVLFDECDASFVLAQKWRLLKTATGHKYAQRTNLGFTMHRDLLRANPGQLVDHVNGNGLDNRRHNIRIATGTQNCGNQRKVRGTSKYKGVHWDIRAKRWHAQIGGATTKFLGNFFSEEDAARAYNVAAAAYFGEFALLNTLSMESLDDQREPARVSFMGIPCAVLTHGQRAATIQLLDTAQIEGRFFCKGRIMTNVSLPRLVGGPKPKVRPSTANPELLRLPGKKSGGARSAAIVRAMNEEWMSTEMLATLFGLRVNTARAHLSRLSKVGILEKRRLFGQTGQPCEWRKAS